MRHTLTLDNWPTVNQSRAHWPSDVVVSPWAVIGKIRKGCPGFCEFY